MLHFAHQIPITNGLAAEGPEATCWDLLVEGYKFQTSKLKAVIVAKEAKPR
jgi:hypothetical protein